MPNPKRRHSNARTQSRRAHDALSKPAPVKLPSAAQASIVLAGSPPPLAALHKQAGQLLGSGSALTTRLEALRAPRTMGHGPPAQFHVARPPAPFLTTR